MKLAVVGEGRSETTPIGTRGEPLRIAVSGKGGAGKSLVSGILARVLARQHRVLVVDLDVLPGVALSLGRPGGSPVVRGVAPFERLLERLTEPAPDGVRLLPAATYASRGKVGPVLTTLAAFAGASHRLARGRPLARWSIVGDLPAGPRPTAYRQYIAYADVLLVIAEPTVQSILTAQRVLRMSRSRPELAVRVVANKVADEEDAELLERELGEPIFATIPFDEEVRAAERCGEALVDRAPDSPAVVAVEEIVAALRA
ncbi:MAG: hypothetical protein H0T43_10935 [Solirubrobacterales bacterium]|nr:hypothetical protein [Solirubrobacterales bacterium]